MALNLRNSQVIGKTQTFYIIGAIALVALLYFGFNRTPTSQEALEKSRALNTQEFDIRSLEKEAQPDLKEDEFSYLETLHAQLGHVTQDSQKLRLQKSLSGFWFGLRKPIIAGLYAKEAAAIENTAESWSITGTTFAAALQNKELPDKQLAFARDQAVDAFEKAISLEPKEVGHRINQALCYIEAPVQETPMKGVQMLAGLATNFPESALPPYHLARLAVRTNQMERAAERIQQALVIEPNNQRIACLAVEIYTALQQPDMVQQYQPVCSNAQ